MLIDAGLCGLLADMYDRDADHLRTLSILYYVSAGLSGFGILAMCVYLTIGAVVVVGGASSNSNGSAEVAVFGSLFLVVMGVVFLLAVAMCAATIMCGRWLSERRNYVFCMVVAGLHCLSFPLGTALGVFTLIVLSRESVKQSFEANRAAIPAG